MARDVSSGEPTTGQGDFLTVAEAAKQLHVAPNTVYRWCRAGRLPAVKIGKEWRIPADQLRRAAEPMGLTRLDALLQQIMGRSEHLLGLASNELALGRMEATFFDAAAASGGRLVYARWEESATAVRRRLRPALYRARERVRALHLVEFQKAYEEREVEGPPRLLLQQVERSRRDGVHCCAYGSPHGYFQFHYDRLVAFERGMDESVRQQPVVVLCGYPLANLHEGWPLSVFVELMGCHSGVVWFDGQRALLQRPAGRMW